RKATLGKFRYDWEWCEVELEEMSSNDLAGEADVGQAGLGAKCKWRRSPASQQPLIGRQALRRPMLSPLFDRVRVGAEGLRNMIANARRHKWMGIGDRHQGQRTRIGALLRI